MGTLLVRELEKEKAPEGNVGWREEGLAGWSGKTTLGYPLLQIAMGGQERALWGGA